MPYVSNDAVRSERRHKAANTPYLFEELSAMRLERTRIMKQVKARARDHKNVSRPPASATTRQQQGLFLGLDRCQYVSANGRHKRPEIGRRGKPSYPCVYVRNVPGCSLTSLFTCSLLGQRCFQGALFTVAAL